MEKLWVKTKKELARDLLSGVILALVSVPLSMGYAQIAGLPARYGLYGSLLPVLAFGVLTSSPRFVFGVDAVPAALAGTLLAELGVASGSAEAVALAPVITILTALWLWLFWAVGAGRFVKFVSEPVLGGCVSGISCIVILMLLPQLFGGSIGMGKAPALIAHLSAEAEVFHPLSFCLGLGTVLLVLLSRRLFPRISMSVILMAVGMLLGAVFRIDRYGVALLPALSPGLPAFATSNVALLDGHFGRLLLSTMTMALVIVSETLLSTRGMARKHGEKVDNQREILAYAVGNMIAAMFGSSPVSGSISRTKRAEKFQVTSQWMSVAMCAVTALVLLFGAGFLRYMPLPILTGIVIASLVSMLEFGLAARLWKVDRAKFLVFLAAFLADFLGLTEGVLVGVVLSFASFTIGSSMHPRYFLGCLEGEDGFFSLSQTPHARPIAGTVLYQFNGTLFFANVDDFQGDIEGALKDDTRLVVVTGVTGVDITAAEHLLELYRSMKQRGVSLALAGHASVVNEQLIALGAEELIREGAVKPRLTQALSDSGLRPPYPLSGAKSDSSSILEGAALETFTWAYGKFAAPRLEELARRLAREILSSGRFTDAQLAQAKREVAGAYWNAVDEEQFLDLLEMSLAVAYRESRESGQAFLRLSRELNRRRIRLDRELWQGGDAAAAEESMRLRLYREENFRRRHPEAAALLIAQRQEYMRTLRRAEPALAEFIWELILHTEFANTVSDAASANAETTY